MDSRREFFKKAAALTGGAGLLNLLLPSIERAAAITPTEGSSFLDAEHVVILMQENRSFDHCFGSLRGVRGFNDPRAVTLPNQNPVWLQTNAEGKTYAPFRLDAQRTNSTWLGSLPHSWTDQNDAKNHGDHDKWLIAKPSSHAEATGMPLTMGYYTREDLPFYYALADAFTICDQHFCSCLTGTTPNRLYLWSGTVREQQTATSPANVRNENVDYGSPARWTTFPERLEAAGLSWRIYQNELNVASGLVEEEDAWLANFSDNPIEWFPQFKVEYASKHREHAAELLKSLPGEIVELEKRAPATTDDRSKAHLEGQLKSKRELYAWLQQGQQEIDQRSFNELPELNQELHNKAFTVNSGDPHYRSLTHLEYDDNGENRKLMVPKGDVLHQFRQDVTTGKLPSVSWIVAPEKFSDHPTAPWYGAWYVAEVMNILTQNADVWRKTIFILTYDENDGFFDHVPPFGAPLTGHPETGAVSGGIDTGVEHHTLEQDLAKHTPAKARGGSIGLGFRVPLLIASPWSRGGFVCSQVFDHTSVLQLLEKFASKRRGKPVTETNITEWRRTVCGDLSSAFGPEVDDSAKLPFPAKDAFIERIHLAQFQNPPSYHALSAAQIEEYRQVARPPLWMPRQEPGIRPSRALPYELFAEGRLTSDRRSLQLTLAARNVRFGERAAGSPFHVYAPGQYLHEGASNRTRSYALKAGQSLQDSWMLAGFTGDRYHLRVCGPNGFLLELAGDSNDPQLVIEAAYAPSLSSRALRLSLENGGKAGSYTVSIKHHAYGFAHQRRVVKPGSASVLNLDLERSYGWYDFSVMVEGQEKFERHYAGRVETGRPSFSDPQIGGTSV